MIFMFTVNIASALSLYWLVGGLVAFIQQAIVLGKDEAEMEEIADKPSSKDLSAIPEAEIVPTPGAAKSAKPRRKRKKKR